MKILIENKGSIFVVDGISIASRTVYLERVFVNNDSEAIEYLEEYDSIKLIDFLGLLWRLFAEMAGKERQNEKRWSIGVKNE